VVLLLLLALLLGLHRMIYSTAVLDEVVAEHIGGLALTLAESALEELQFLVRDVANRFGEPVYDRFRKEFTRNPEPGFEAAELVARLRRTGEMAGRPPYSGFGLTVDVDAPRITFRRLFENGPSNYGEHYGTVAYRVTAGATYGRRRVERTIRAFQEFKVVAAVVPRPFDQVCFYAVSADGLVGPSANAAAVTFSGIRKDWLDFLRLYRGSASGKLSPSMDQLEADLTAIPEFQPRPSAPGVTDPFVHPFVFPMTAFIQPSVAREQRTFRGEDLDLATFLRGKDQEIVRMQIKVRAQVESFIKKNRSALPPELPPDLFAQLSDLKDRIKKCQLAIKRWQSIFFQATGPTRDRLVNELKRLDPEALRRKAFLEIRERNPGRPIDEEFTLLRTEMSGRTGSDLLNGILWVDNPSTRLDLTGWDTPGRLIVVTAGPALVGTMRRSPGPHHLAVIAQKELTIKGEFTGAAVALGPYRIDGPSTIRGGLLLARPVTGSLQGLTIEYDPGLLSGSVEGGRVRYSPRHFYVAIAPRLSGSEIVRSR
jgi:hypothetical protein